ESKYMEPLEARLLVGSYENQIMGKAVITKEEDDILFITIGPLGWKHELENLNGNKYIFESDGHLFPVEFNLNKKGEKVVSMSVDLGHGENLGDWKKK
ncbi:MAG: hypothetical protein J5495_02270, partial [Bacteroidales bacterium]|nr:hypothetical protein [Bacteroidales bacterium]